MEHSPMPWQLKSGGYDKKSMIERPSWITDAEQGLVCVLGSGVVHARNAEANGNLLQAAPQLLAACKAVLEFIPRREFPALHRQLTLAIVNAQRGAQAFKMLESQYMEKFQQKEIKK